MGIVVLGLSVYYTDTSFEMIKKSQAEKIFFSRVNEYKAFLKDKTDFLKAFAKFISDSEEIKGAYLTNDRQRIITFVKPLYENLHKKGLIEELHFFKRPAVSFVNFANLGVYNIDVSKARADIVWVTSSFTPSVHFYVCRLYPGLRATYPIVKDDKLLGSVSFGIHINVFRDIFKNLSTQDVSIYLNDNELKTMLLEKRYEKYAKLPKYKKYRVIGDVFDVDLRPGYQIKDKNIYTVIEIKDFFDKTMGYLVIKDNLLKDISLLRKRATQKLILEIIGFVFVFAIIFLLFKWLFDKLQEMDNILKIIRNQEFDKIPPKVEEKDELDKFKNRLIDVAQDIKAYIYLLTQQVEQYSDKAYKDALTGAFNRRFLEEKAKELFLKYKIAKTQLGVIMLDIDDFKKINDTYGHDVGDMVLIKLAETIKSHIRKNDVFIRYGGEEFVLLLPDSNIDETYKTAEKIRKAVEESEVKVGSKILKFTISLGVSELRESDESLFESIKRADDNLYKAKKSGKNRVEV